MICPHCGAENSAGRNFCYVCATPLTLAASHPAAPPMAPNENPPVFPPASTEPTRPSPAPGSPPPVSPYPVQHPPRPVDSSPPVPPSAGQSSAQRSILVWALIGLLALGLLGAIVVWPMLSGTASQQPIPSPQAKAKTLPPTALPQPTDAPQAKANPLPATATPLPTLAPQSKANPLPATATPLPTARPPARVRAGEQLLIPRASRPPILDGSLSDEWGGEGIPVQYVVYGQETLSGPGDLSGRLWYAWDDNALYIASLVLDDVFSQTSRGETLYLGDSVEIQWDVDLEGDFESNEFNADDWHIGLSPGNFRDLPPEAFVWTPRPQTGAAAGIQVAAQRFTTTESRQGFPLQGYTLEAAIPWRLIGIVPRGGQAFGFCFSISDNDQPAPTQQSMLSTAPGREWHKPLTFNTMILKTND